jgi:hypothetical protein
VAAEVAAAAVAGAWVAAGAGALVEVADPQADIIMLKAISSPTRTNILLFMVSPLYCLM